MDYEKIRPLKIGLLGYTSDLSLKGLRQIYENNKEDIDGDRIFNNGSHSYIKFKDGAVIETLNYNEISLRGRKFDQLILFDDNRWEILTHKIDMIYYIQSYTMFYSFVPDEYQIILYEDIR